MGYKGEVYSALYGVFEKIGGEYGHRIRIPVRRTFGLVEYISERRWWHAVVGAIVMGTIAIETVIWSKSTPYSVNRHLVNNIPLPLVSALKSCAWQYYYSAPYGVLIATLPWPLASLASSHVFIHTEYIDVACKGKGAKRWRCKIQKSNFLGR